MFSRRYLSVLGAVIVLALIPTLLHGYIGYTVPSPAVGADDLPAVFEGAPGREGKRTARWIADTYGGESWAERTYTVPGKKDITVFVVRGHDLKKIYHHPELGVLRGYSFAPVRVESLPPTPERFVHVLPPATGGDGAVYALLYEGRWIKDPYQLQFSSSLTSLWAGRRAITLVLASGDVLEGGRVSASTSRLLAQIDERLAHGGS